MKGRTEETVTSKEENGILHEKENDFDYVYEYNHVFTILPQQLLLVLSSS